MLDKGRCTAQGGGAHRSPVQTIRHFYESHVSQEKIKPPDFNFNLKISRPCKDGRSPCHMVDEHSQRCSELGARPVRCARCNSAKAGPYSAVVVDLPCSCYMLLGPCSSGKVISP